MPLQLLTPPSAEPMHLNDAMLHINQTAGVDDAHIVSSIMAARRSVENRTWRQLIAARYRQTLDSFPGVGQSGVPWGQRFTMPGNAIFLDRAPVLEVTSIQYLAMDGTIQTVDPTTYTVDAVCEPCRITPVFGKLWPIALPQIGAVWVTFITGFASPITSDATTGTFTVKTWKTLAVGEAVRFSNSGGALPTPLQIGTDYYVAAVVAPGVYQLTDAPGGAAISLSSTVTGTSFIGEVPGDLLAWMRLRLGSLDVFREETIAMNRGKIEALPFVDGLLYGYATW